MAHKDDLSKQRVRFWGGGGGSKSEFLNPYNCSLSGFFKSNPNSPSKRIFGKDLKKVFLTSGFPNKNWYTNALHASHSN